ncbi:MAG: hypothetical protein WBE65_11605, partial [Steroidobacteraceae bacterium]
NRPGRSTYPDEKSVLTSGATPDFRVGLRWYDPMERIAGRHVLERTQDIANVAALAPSSDTTPGPGRWLEQGARLYVRPLRVVSRRTGRRE